jgi:hypothetical protein
MTTQPPSTDPLQDEKKSVKSTGRIESGAVALRRLCRPRSRLCSPPACDPSDHRQPISHPFLCYSFPRSIWVWDWALDGWKPPMAARLAMTWSQVGSAAPVGIFFLCMDLHTHDADLATVLQSEF